MSPAKEAIPDVYLIFSLAGFVPLLPSKRRAPGHHTQEGHCPDAEVPVESLERDTLHRLIQCKLSSAPD
jgi:hypothetical protein